MAPGITLDVSSDFNPSQTTHSSNRTLLLSPSSLASHSDKLETILRSHPRDVTDLQMIDRLSVGLVRLPESTYDVVVILNDADGTRTESCKLIDRSVLDKILHALKPRGRLTSEDGTFTKTNADEKAEAILAGFVDDGGDGVVKPTQATTAAVPLRFGAKKQKQTTDIPKDENQTKVEPGVGFVDFSDDFDPILDDDGDDELIDEDTLLDESDIARPIVVPPQCRPKAGKRRRACKDCTCGLAEKIAAEDAAKRAKADAELKTMKLKVDDLAEVDFTVKGKVGSCGNCSLGDAFRCDGCPYIGLPPFKPGEEVRLLNNEIQL